MLKPPAGLAALILSGAILPSSTSAEAPEREASIIVYGEDPCPEARDEGEIVVCARRPEEERYRIPAPLRRGSELREQSWSSQAMQLEDAQRDGRPNSCSVVGSFGQTGCTQQMLRSWTAERRNRRPDR